MCLCSLQLSDMWPYCVAVLQARGQSAYKYGQDIWVWIKQHAPSQGYPQCSVVPNGVEIYVSPARRTFAADEEDGSTRELDAFTRHAGRKQRSKAVAHLLTYAEEGDMDKRILWVRDTLCER
jgi:hypothetical protein